MTHEPRITGGCLCGACRYTSDGTPLNVRACHCRQCQKATGSAFYARVIMPLDGLHVSGPVSWYDAESGLRRGFCSQCGSTLFSARPSAGTVGIALGSLDEPDRFEPTEHIWTSRKQAWLSIDDGRPQYDEGIPPVVAPR
ncbi:GFA family protein [Trinickia soli]|uniref:GFA family protein n=1 Tax=Trinickia soli TaxID=380675 RepID=A0A2N7WB12_9BURK|nr:GFA family protein [Trinickia soli]PMS26581.1 GFA family protein [Trinickia soli]CAB3695514.1 hypothetical protein LMG24076_03152 [Trinickia soli]